MTRKAFQLTAAQALPYDNALLRAFIQTNSGNPVIGSLAESTVGGVKSVFFGIRNYGGNAGILITAILDNNIGDKAIMVTIDQDGAALDHEPIFYDGM